MLSENNSIVALSDNDLLSEAERQLNICNACRYCEGYCAVFPALERRTLLSKGDMLHLANLCHDCRDCYYACPYSPPHPFGVNPPQILAELRMRTYDDGLGTFENRLPIGLRGWRGFSLAFLVSLFMIVTIVVATRGVGSIWSSHSHVGTPYNVVPYIAILVVTLIPFMWSIFAMTFSAKRYWHSTEGQMRKEFNLRSLGRTILYAGQLQYLKGGGANCSYPKDEMSPKRRRFHALIFYGFSALVISTVSAGISQDILGSFPPYRFVSVPVIFGVVGGISMIIGTTALIALKMQADPDPTNHQMALRDYGFLVALDALGLSGLLTFLLRSTSAFGIAFVIHLSIVVLTFAIAPYTKFVHFIYRFLSMTRDNLENDLE